MGKAKMTKPRPCMEPAPMFIFYELLAITANEMIEDKYFRSFFKAHNELTAH